MAKKKAAAKSAKMVYYFGKTKTEGKGKGKDLLGGKGLNLAEMTKIGLPVPPGFTITTEVCAKYISGGDKLPKGMMDEVKKTVTTLEKELKKKFGDEKNPLLVSVRSGAAVSMPGMMNTILNLGLTDASVVGLANATDNERFAYDAYRRLINMFGDVVMGMEHEVFEAEFDKIKAKYNVIEDNEVPAVGLVELCDAYKKAYRKHTKQDFPQDPYVQLQLAIESVFGSWNTSRAIRYREVENIRGLLGTAVNVQSMVYGNMGPDSGTGVAFTRDPSTGQNKFYGEFLINAQGEDVVAGIRTPKPVSEMSKWKKAIYKQLLDIKTILENHYKDVQDIEFTIENSVLFMLQTRAGKRTGAAAVKIACDMVKEGLIDKKTALLRIPANDLTQLLLPSFDAKGKKSAKVLTRGLPASPGASVGALAFTADEAVDRTLAGEKVLLVRKETSPEDIDGMHSAAGNFNGVSGSIGADYHITDNLRFGGSAYRTERAPNSEELFSNGPHLATNQFEIGNVNLDKETANGVELSLRYREGGNHLTLNGFYTYYNDYIFELLTGNTVTTDEGDILPISQFTASDAVFKGFELDLGKSIGEWKGFDLAVDASFEYVEAVLRGPIQGFLPRIPPFGVSVGINADGDRWLFRVELDYKSEQNKLAIGELPSDQYALINTFITYDIRDDTVLHLSLHNLTNQEARQHTSFLKENVPLPGRNFKASLTYVF
ncbi:MAG: pyruvate, phosphate dikinase [Robiginitomaculum sp.]|nr:pyruvate, phosphate dikinase [Robiginitomaculum sp.]